MALVPYCSHVRGNTLARTRPATHIHADAIVTLLNTVPITLTEDYI